MNMRRSSVPWFQRLAMVVMVIVVATVTAQPASALSARDLKNTGLVGETLNGYLGLVQGDAAADIRQAMEAINAGRRQAYQQAAADTGRTPDEVEAVAGARLRTKAQPGDWVQDTSGQ